MKNSKLNNIFNDYIIPEDFEFSIKFMNIELVNNEHKIINILVDYINKSNYFGDTYHTCFENQKKSTKFWIDYFFNSNYKKTKDELKSFINNVIKENISKMNEMFKLLI